MVKRYLNDLHLECKWKSNVDEVLDVVQDYRPAVVISDVRLPEKTEGFELCYQIKSRWPKIQVLLLSGLQEVEHIVKGLSLGADDYLVKPFEPEEFKARVQVLVRRSAEYENFKSEPRQELRHGPLHLDLQRQELRHQDKLVPLKPREFQLLLYLVQHQGQTCSRERLQRELWQDTEAGLRTVDTYIKRLRQILGPDGDMLHTIQGIGYALYPPRPAP